MNFMFAGTKVTKQKKKNKKHKQNTEYAFIEAAALPFIYSLPFQNSDERISEFMYVLLQSSSISTP